jgi:transcriptional regulator with XRE-family HTH domain
VVEPTVESASPTVLKWWIAAELRRLREAGGCTRRQAAERLGKATAQIGHLETGRNLPTAADLEVLLTCYGVPRRVELFRDLLHQAKRGRDWWSDYTDAMHGSLGLLLGLEALAAQIHGYHAVLVPEILQAPSYAEAVIHGGDLVGPDPAGPDHQVARRVELRMARQQILFGRDEPPQLFAVLDEGVLHRQVGGPQVLGEQLNRLVELAEYPNIDIRVLPTTAAACTVAAAFTWLTFSPELENDHGVVHVETLTCNNYYDKPVDVLSYRHALTTLRAHALSGAESVLLIERIAKELT